MIIAPKRRSGSSHSRCLSSGRYYACYGVVEPVAALNPYTATGICARTVSRDRALRERHHRAGPGRQENRRNSCARCRRLFHAARHRPTGRAERTTLAGSPVRQIGAWPMSNARSWLRGAPNLPKRNARELLPADRLDGRPAQVLEHSGPDSEPIGRIVREIVHVNVSPEEISAAEDEPLLIEWCAVRDGNGNVRGGG
jgi:hypothetical protein